MHRVSNVSRSFATGFAAVLLLLCCGQLAVGAGFVVTTPVDEDDGTADPGTGAGTSLREAINAANAAPDADTITFAPILVVGGDATVSLTTSLGDAATGGYGPSAFMITTDITIQGPSGDNGITITRGSGTFRLFLVTDAGSLALEDVTLSNGYATGYNGGRSAFCGGGGGAGMGGAILNRGTLDLVGVTLTGNTARGGVGGDDPWPFSYGSGGGGGMGGHGQDGSGSSGGYGGGVNGGIGGMAAAAVAAGRTPSPLAATAVSAAVAAVPTTIRVMAVSAAAVVVGISPWGWEALAAATAASGLAAVAAVSAAPCSTTAERWRSPTVLSPATRHRAAAPGRRTPVPRP